MGLFLFIIIAIASFAVQWRFKSKFKEYSETPLLSGLSGKDVAAKMLHDNGIYDVQIVSVEGQLGDHYNPENKTVNLSPEVYQGRSIAAAAVAAHECGHAVQHAKAYSWLRFRSAMVPVVSVAANLLQWVFMLGLIMAFSSLGYTMLLIAFGAMIVVTLFSVVTLPVEFDASNRALAWLRTNQGIMQTSDENVKAKDALWWAAMTYVVAALGSIAQLLYLAMMLFGGRRD
ncbi:zinc metallopeptidase (plasmid) [Pedobacter sp. BS3]|uniref:zinc metallopeptidase n=1 Tax=Pedobacter sp. BS3 TaxID=2567937 RepID=UPI0011EF1003|nr:zinc metallopeptidase [Pedobacter sp. BS3]TZF86515.1 zinc metallopeptidase [Pedobacter sp. BS3]